MNVLNKINLNKSELLYKINLDNKSYFLVKKDTYIILCLDNSIIWSIDCGDHNYKLAVSQNDINYTIYIATSTALKAIDFSSCLANEYAIKWENQLSCCTDILTYDLNSDGKDEILIGNKVFDSEGSTLWTTPEPFPTSIWIGEIDNNPARNVKILIDGKYLTLHNWLGEKIWSIENSTKNEKIIVGKFRWDYIEFQIVTISNSYLTMYNFEGKLIQQKYIETATNMEIIRDFNKDNTDYLSIEVDGKCFVLNGLFDIVSPLDTPKEIIVSDNSIKNSIIDFRKTLNGELIYYNYIEKLAEEDFVYSDSKSHFDIDVENGDYLVEIIIGSMTNNTIANIFAQDRRLMVYNLELTKNIFINVEFVVHVMNKKLSLAIIGDNLEIKGVKSTITNQCTNIFLAGDSTVTDQLEAPWNGWGQILPSFFNENVSVSNYAYSGRSTTSFIKEKRLDRILKIIKPNDYLFIQFGHNDQKLGSSHTIADSSYIQTLKIYINEARKRGAIPVLVTAMHRRDFDTNGILNNTLENYPDAMRTLAKEENVSIIDLNEKSFNLISNYGVEKSKELFVFIPPNTNKKFLNGFEDNTHFSFLGAYKMAQLVVDGIIEGNLVLKKYLK